MGSNTCALATIQKRLSFSKGDPAYLQIAEALPKAKS